MIDPVDIRVSAKDRRRSVPKLTIEQITSQIPATSGESAYDVAVRNGFEGTEQQWLLTLIGPKGADSTVPGPAGAASIVPGPQGPQGPAFTYSDFTPEQLLALKGAQGDPGATGAPGSDATVTKQAVENVLTGEINTHSHAGVSATPTSWGKYF